MTIEIDKARADVSNARKRVAKADIEVREAEIALKAANDKLIEAINATDYSESYKRTLQNEKE